MYSTGGVTVGVRTSTLPDQASKVYRAGAVASVVTKYWHNPCEQTSSQTLMNQCYSLTELYCRHDSVYFQVDVVKLGWE